MYSNHTVSELINSDMLLIVNQQDEVREGPPLSQKESIELHKHSIRRYNRIKTKDVPRYVAPAPPPVPIQAAA